MKKFRKKQRILYKIMKALVIFTAVFIFAYIGAYPYVMEYSKNLAVGINYFCDIDVVICLTIIFVYYSKYGKSDYFLSSIEDEINDAGYYFTSRESVGCDDYVDEMFNDLTSNKYSASKNVNCNDFSFDIRAYKKHDYFYAVAIDDLDKNDVLAYLDEAINDITVKNLKRKGNAVLCFVTNRAGDDAIALSKMITPIGRKMQLKIALAIVEPQSKKVYFQGIKDTRCKKLIANYVMNCDIPIKEKYICKDKLQFQFDIENKMESFNIKDFKNGNFYIR